MFACLASQGVYLVVCQLRTRTNPKLVLNYSTPQVGEQESDDFDWRNVNIPTGDSNIKTYEDASMQEELRTDADKAFKLAELESMLSAKEPKKGYFGANMRGTKEQVSSSFC